MIKLTSRFDDAFRYANEAHATQTRKGTGAPYLGHLMGVASIVLDDGGGEDEAIAALLHDAAEDQGGRERLDDIRTRFGDLVARIVEDCTDSF
jgi:(p)ppGpp synthase/HD superfamily hydrolase